MKLGIPDFWKKVGEVGSLESIIEVNTPYKLRNAYIQDISKSYPETETFKIIQGALDNVWYDGRLL